MFKESEIVILDNYVFASEEEQINRNLNDYSWRLGWPKATPFHVRPGWQHFIAGKSRPEKLSYEEELVSDKKWSFLNDIWIRAKNQFLPNATLLGVYANGQTFGQDSPIHRDVGRREKGKTLLLFCNPSWPAAWGGELVFYNDEKDDIIKAVLPKPKRAVIFNGVIPHSARSPSLMCDQLRMTIAFKTIEKDQNGQ